MPDIEEWLRGEGFGGYVDAFRDADISYDLLIELDGDDLKELGLNLGDRKRFLRAVARMGDEAAAETAVPATAAPVTADSTAPGHHPSHAERRRLTVMFVDLIGSTTLSSQMDPEEWSEVIQSYQDAVAGVVTRYDGHIAQYLGDGVLCYFGWPRALEDAAERAVEAGLAIKSATERVKAKGKPLVCRVGIATGLVVIGDLVARGDGHEPTAIGDTPNFAARLQEFAQPGQVVVSESTRRLLGTAFRIESLGQHGFKGLPGTHEVFAVLGRDPGHDRFAARATASTGVMVGRGNELALLTGRWEASVGGEGQVVLLTGEAGIGKSRVCRALFDSLSRDDYIRVRLQCSPYQRDSAFWPVINQGLSAAGIEQTQSDDEKLDRLEALLRQSDQTDRQTLAVMADLFGLPGEKRYGKLDLPPQARRSATFAALTEHAIGLSRKKPLMMLIEDAHWCDPTTLEVIGLFAEQIERERVMLLITSRPEGQPAMQPLAHATTLMLNRLGRAGVEEIVARLGGDKLPAEAITAIIERTDGVPLFVEELTKALVESGETSVPASLHDTLMARLDRIPEVKEVAQIASVIGREFDADPLAQIAALSQQKILTALDDLQKVELVFPRGTRSGHYIFKHALVRDAAYESLLNRRRQEIHSRIFDVLRENEMTMPGVLASHATEAGRLNEAVQYGRFAAEEALRRPAYAEAITHLETALGVLVMRERNEAVQRERSRLLLLAGQARIAHSGYAAEATLSTYAEIELIATELGDKELLIEGLYGRWAGHYVPGRLTTALEVAETIRTVSDEVEDSLARALGHRLRGTVLTMMGRVGDAVPELDAVDSFYDPENHPAQASRFGQDVRIARDCYLLGVRTLEGRYDTAASLARQVLSDLETIDHAHTTGYAMGHLALFLCAAEIEPLGTEIATRCIDISERNRMPLWAALGHASQAMSQVYRGAGDEALPAFSTALEMLGRLSFDVFRPMLLPAHALALARSGNFEAAEANLAEARGYVERDDARFAEAEILRVGGQLALMQGDARSAETAFRQALERAIALGHVSWELRAAEDLAALLGHEGGGAAGREHLAAAQAKFAEGHDLPPLKRAARLLEKA